MPQLPPFLPHLSYLPMQNPHMPRIFLLLVFDRNQIDPAPRNKKEKHPQSRSLFHKSMPCVQRSLRFGLQAVRDQVDLLQNEEEVRGEDGKEGMPFLPQIERSQLLQLLECRLQKTILQQMHRRVLPRSFKRVPEQRMALLCLPGKMQLQQLRGLKSHHPQGD